MRADGHCQRLSARLFRKPWCPCVGHSDLQGAKPLLTQAGPVPANLLVRCLRTLRRAHHGSSSRSLHVTWTPPHSGASGEGAGFQQRRARTQRRTPSGFKRRLPSPEEIGLRYPDQVSGGQLPRAMTAMAMACRPDLIVFDEPTAAPDVTTRIEVLAAIRDVVERSRARVQPRQRNADNEWLRYRGGDVGCGCWSGIHAVAPSFAVPRPSAAATASMKAASFAGSSAPSERTPVQRSTP